MKKKEYVKPKVEVVEIQLSECIAGSVQTGNVTVKAGQKTTTVKEQMGGDVSWDSNF